MQDAVNAVVLASDMIAQIQNVPHFGTETGQILYLNHRNAGISDVNFTCRVREGSNTELLLYADLQSA